MDAKTFARVVDTSDIEKKFITMSRDLVNAYHEIVGKDVTIVDCKANVSNALDDVSKVFSKSIRAFLESKTLKYSKDEPPLELEEFSKVETSVSDLRKYIVVSERVVDSYVKIGEISQAQITPVTCNNKEDVNKVFSHSARAFLACADSRLYYTEEEPEPVK